MAADSECITGLISKSKVEKAMFEEQKQSASLMRSGCANIDNSRSCLPGVKLTRVIKGKASAPIQFNTLNDDECITECGDSGWGKAVCGIIDMKICLPNDGLTDRLQCEYEEQVGVVDKFMDDVAGIWNKGAEQFALSTVIAATTGMQTTGGVQTCNNVPLNDESEDGLEVQAFNTTMAMSVKAFAGVDRKNFQCAFMHPDVVAYLEQTEQMQGAECCAAVSLEQKAMWGDYGTPDGKYLGMWIYECDAIQPESRRARPAVGGGFEYVLLYPTIFGRHGGFMFSNVSTPRKVIQSEEDISCDTEKLYSRQRWCLGVMNAEFLWDDLTGDETDVLPEACDLADPANWKNGAYNSDDCYVLGTGGESGATKVPNLNRGDINQLNCDGAENTPPVSPDNGSSAVGVRYADKFNSYFVIYWAPLITYIPSKTT